MKVHGHYQQKNGGDATEAWIEARTGKITASEFERIVDDDGCLRKGEMPKTYLAEKLAERWTGHGSGGFISQAVNNGIIIEEKAVAFAQLYYGLKIKTVGFVELDDKPVGCSPDGLVGWGVDFAIDRPTVLPQGCAFNFDAGGSGIEIKCPELKTHIGYILAGKLPADYKAQVQGSMFVTGCSTWHFLSYPLACHIDNFPAFHLIIERDDDYQSNLSGALNKFCATYEKAWQKLVEMNGGPPPPRQRMIFSTDKYREEPETSDKPDVGN